MNPPQEINWYIGTMGFSYSDWKGAFYPESLQPKNYLRYYSRVFNSVEIDSTFYGVPKARVVMNWFHNTPEGFRFCVKAPQEITHQGKVDKAFDVLNDFLKAIELLGDKLGVILFQFPPSFSADNLPLIRKLLINLPRGFRYAVEFRDMSWYTAALNHEDPEIIELFHQVNACWAATEYPGLPARIFPLCDYLYVRWIGKHGSFRKHNQEIIDRTENLAQWIMNIQEYGRFQQIFGFLNNDYAGFGAKTAYRLMEILDLPRVPFNPTRQERLL